MDSLKRKILRISLIGPGAVGQAIGASMSLDSRVELAAIGREGPQEIRSVVKFADQEIALEIPERTGEWVAKSDLFVIAVKAYDLGEALASARIYCLDFSKVLFVVNGAVDEVVRDYSSVRWAVTMLGSRAEDAHLRVVNYQSGIQFGSLSSNEKTEADVLFESIAGLIQFSHLGNFHYVMRRKWLFNSVINTLVVRLGLGKNGALLDHPVEMNRLFKRAYHYAAKTWIPEPWNEDELYDEMLKLIQNTASNTNSMAADIAAGRRTEADFLANLMEE